MSIREVVQKNIVMGVDEVVAWAIDVSNWCSNPTNPAVALYDETNDMLDVSSTCLDGTASASDSTVTTPYIKSLTQGHTYRCEVQFAESGNTFECFFRIRAER
jgi:hypothetical protein